MELEAELPGFVTVTATGPVAGTVTVAVSVVELTNVVETAAPPKVIVAPLINFDPVTVIVIRAPGAPDVGAMLETTAVGVVTVSANADDVPPPGPGFTICTASEPGVVVAGNVNVIVPGPTSVDEIAEPLNKTCEAAMKPMPVIVMVGDGEANATTVAGLSEVMPGVGLTIWIGKTVESWTACVEVDGF